MHIQRSANQTILASVLNLCNRVEDSDRSIRARLETVTRKQKTQRHRGFAGDSSSHYWFGAAGFN